MSILKANQITHVSGTSGISLDASGNAIVAGTINAANGLGWRNRIINGDMRIDQRNAGNAVTVTGQTFPVDRFYAAQSTDGTITTQRSTNAPSGFTHSVLITATLGDAALGANQFVLLRQVIEGNNVSDLAWGAAAAATVTLSFWVRSSTTGLFSGTLKNAAQNRAYVFSYTINAANTWEQKSVTIPGDTSGTWLTDNGVGIILDFAVGIGSSFMATAGSWVAGSPVGVAGQVNAMATNGATFYLTGVQLERGTVATPFEYVEYGEQLRRCQRYYQSFGGSSNYERFAFGMANSTTQGSVSRPLPVVMRATPTVTAAGSFIVINSGGGGTAVTSFTGGENSPEMIGVVFNTASGMTAGNATFLTPNGNVTARLTASAEL